MNIVLRVPYLSLRRGEDRRMNWNGLSSWMIYEEEKIERRLSKGLDLKRKKYKNVNAVFLSHDLFNCRCSSKYAAEKHPL